MPVWGFCADFDSNLQEIMCDTDAVVKDAQVQWDHSEDQEISKLLQSKT